MYGVLSWAAPPRPPSRRSRRSRGCRRCRRPAGPPALRRHAVYVPASDVPFNHVDGHASSELQAALAGGVGERGDPAVVVVATAVEHHRGDAGLAGPGGDQLADLGRARLLVAVQRRGRRPPAWRPRPACGPPASSMSCTTMCRELRLTARRGPLGAADDLLAQPGVPAADRGHGACRPKPGTPRASWRWRSQSLCRPSLTRLPDLAADDLAGVPHALALVRVGLAQLADVGGGLADQLLVDAGAPRTGWASRP